MPSVLGKRKSRKTVDTPSQPAASATQEDASEILRRHFESQFMPVAAKKTGPKKGKKRSAPGEKVSKAEAPGDAKDEDESEDRGTADSDNGDGQDEWAGLSEEDDDQDEDEDEDDDDAEEESSGPGTVEVVDHTSSTPHDPTASMSKRELRSFMSSRVPSTTPSSSTAAQSQSQSKSKSQQDPASDEETERSLRAQDLALQRLLSESHLLTSLTPNTAHSTNASTKLFASGKLRHRTTDLRIQNLASNPSSSASPGSSASPSPAPGSPAPGSVYHQAKMPMAMRKRIVATKTAREEKRRREARENGVILEKSAAKLSVAGGGGGGKRFRAIDAPEVGRMRGAELKLSDGDVRRIEGGGSGGRGGRGGRGGARGGKFGGDRKGRR